MRTLVERRGRGTEVSGSDNSSDKKLSGIMKGVNNDFMMYEGRKRSIEDRNIPPKNSKPSQRRQEIPMIDADGR